MNKKSVRSTRDRRRGKLSLHPLTIEDAVRAAAQTGSPIRKIKRASGLEPDKKIVTVAGKQGRFIKATKTHLLLEFHFANGDVQMWIPRRSIDNNWPYTIDGTAIALSC